MILAGDVGGTKTRLAFYEKQDSQMVCRAIETYPSRDYSDICAVLQAFLRQHAFPVTRAAFGVPGPVVDGVADMMVNLPWKVEESQLAAFLKIDKVKLVNDLVATTASLPHLQPEKLLTLHPGEAAGPGERFAVLAPGTGLGQGFLFFDRNSGRYHVLASEGGHADFAPTNEIQTELFRYLRAKFSRVSYERVLSGQGLVNIYEFLRECGKAEAPAELQQRLAQQDAAAVISGSALTGEFKICVMALDIFAAILGAQAGNLALLLTATGGVYVGGGIAPKICQKLADGTTVAAYLNKGRLSYR
ncbi:MAG: glucokinase, partial [Calditrichaeota bacterium]